MDKETLEIAILCLYTLAWLGLGRETYRYIKETIKNKKSGLWDIFTIGGLTIILAVSSWFVIGVQWVEILHP